MPIPPSTSPISLDSLIFPAPSHSFSKTLTLLKQSRLSIGNRLRSILEDAEFVLRVADTLKLPLVANERCGSWYVPPEKKAGSTYFKSTDGHAGQWKFSTRRLNLQLLEVVERSNGCIIVDSTRRGKAMPDALSKTVPTWCAVMNRLLFPELSAGHLLRTPEEAVGRSEHAQIEARLDGFLEDVRALQLDIRSLRAKVTRPLRPEWVTPSSIITDPVIDERTSGYHRIICCTSSRREGDPGDSEDGAYIQGAGDDSEGWMSGASLTPQLFWNFKEVLQEMDDAEMVEFIKSRALSASSTVGMELPKSISPGDQVFISTLESVDFLRQSGCFNGIVACNEAHIGNTDAADGKVPLLQLKCGTGKLGSRALRKKLLWVQPFLDQILKSGSKTPKILIACDSSRDLSVGVALAILCMNCRDDGTLQPQARTTDIDKTFIRQRLAWIMASKHDSNPSGPTLQAVNGYLMSKPWYSKQCA